MASVGGGYLKILMDYPMINYHNHIIGVMVSD